VRLTFIVTIDPVKALGLLDVLIHSLNLQTQTSFDVVFYNQTRLAEADVFERLLTRPRFAYTFCSVEPSQFLGDFPLWDLFSFHQMLLDRNLVGDYFMSMHMEEWLAPDYVEKVTRVLAATGFDILLGNLCRTDLDVEHAREICGTRDAGELGEYARRRGLERSSHWAFHRSTPSLAGRLTAARRNAHAFAAFGFRTRLVPTRAGFTRMAGHYEDLYFMRRDFARRYDWFLPGRQMFFEDVQLCDIPGVCELGRELRRLTEFPRYFNASRIYHLKHDKHYYQLEDPRFTDALLARKTDDPLLMSLQEAIRLYRGGSLSLHDALRYTRSNPTRTGTQDLNYRYHLEALSRVRPILPK